VVPVAVVVVAKVSLVHPELVELVVTEMAMEQTEPIL
jgi:hypothetical protein